MYLRCSVMDAVHHTLCLDSVLLCSVLLQPLEVPEASLLQDLQSRAQSILLFLQILQTFNLRGARTSQVQTRQKMKV